MRLEGRKVLITGAAGAIGNGLAFGFAREGADVVVHYHHSEKRAKETVKEITAMGRQAIAIKADVTKPEAIHSLIDEAVMAMGRIDIIVNNAITGPQIPLLDLTLEVIDSTFTTNLRGYFLVAQFGARQMIKQKSRGWIVNISSISSRSVTSTYVHYAATKGGIEAMTRGMAVALAPFGINVNCVAPGVVYTPTVKNMFQVPKNADPVISRTPTGLVTTIEDCIEPVIFFCLDATKAVTGQVLDVDGGYSIHGMEWVMTEEMVKFRSTLESKGSDSVSLKNT